MQKNCIKEIGQENKKSVFFNFKSKIKSVFLEMDPTILEQKFVETEIQINQLKIQLLQKSIERSQMRLEILQLEVQVKEAEKDQEIAIKQF